MLYFSSQFFAVHTPTRAQIAVSNRDISRELLCSDLVASFRQIPLTPLLCRRYNADSHKGLYRDVQRVSGFEASGTQKTIKRKQLHISPAKT